MLALLTLTYITLTLAQNLKRHTIAPRGSRIRYENARQGAAIAPGGWRMGKAPRSDCGDAVNMMR